MITGRFSVTDAERWWIFGIQQTSGYLITGLTRGNERDTAPSQRAAPKRIRALAYRGLDSVELRLETLREIRAVVPMDGAFFPTADRATLLYTSAVRIDMPDGVTGEFLDNEFHSQDVNKFRSLAQASS